MIRDSIRIHNDMKLVNAILKMKKCKNKEYELNTVISFKVYDDKIKLGNY